MNAGHQIVLFDGECAFCNGWVNWIRKRDRAGRFRFVALTSPEGANLRSTHRIPEHLDSVVLVQGGSAYVRSDAAWRILAALPGRAPCAWVLRIIPRPLRNWAYDLVARNRHRFGMNDECELPAR